VITRFGPGGENGDAGGTGIAFYNAAPYAETNGRIVRYALSTRIADYMFQPPRLMAEGVNVDPLGSCMIGASVFPDMFRGLVAIAPDAWMVAPLGV
jgi:hypothetical protein